MGFFETLVEEAIKVVPMAIASGVLGSQQGKATAQREGELLDKKAEADTKLKEMELEAEKQMMKEKLAAELKSALMGEVGKGYTNLLEAILRGGDMQRAAMTTLAGTGKGL